MSLPKIQPKWKRTFHSNDLSPSLKGDGDTCQTCQKNQARYTCPKCHSQYCSVDCYKMHDVTSTQTHEGGKCTEMFYRDKVNQLSKLAIKDETNIAQVRDILTRVHYDDEYPQSSENDLDEEDLLELAQCIVRTDYSEQDEHDDSSWNFVSKIPLHLLKKFEEAVDRGEVSDLVHPWQPFWMPSYISSSSTEEKYSCCFDAYTKDGTTLDDRILNITPLNHLSKAKEMFPLQYNVCEILYITAWTIRMHYCVVVKGIHDRADDLKSATFLVIHSHVLSTDARYTNIPEVLLDVTLRFNKHAPRGRCADFDCRMLVEDILYITKERRMVLKVLFAALDIIRSALQVNRNSPKKDFRYKMKLSLKKIEFLLSWSEFYWDTFDFKDEIMDWLDRYIVTANPNDQLSKLPFFFHKDASIKNTYSTSKPIIQVLSDDGRTTD